MSITSIRRGTTALAVSACVAGALTGGAFSASAAPSAPTSQAAAVRLEAQLAASGDPDGSGEAMFRLNAARGRVCAAVSWSGIEKPAAGHIHRRSDSAVVVDLSTSVTGGAHCTSGVSKRLVARIVAHPRRFYFNVHNATYPAGAIQGNLHR
ncbi:MAG: CHRD domain-containing protein [Nocardioides sp.]